MTAFPVQKPSGNERSCTPILPFKKQEKKLKHRAPLWLLFPAPIDEVRVQFKYPNVLFGIDNSPSKRFVVYFRGQITEVLSNKQVRRAWTSG